MVKLVGEDARDLHVAALDVSAGDVLHRNVGGGRGALLPVARRVGTFHADAELVAFGRGGSRPFVVRANEFGNRKSRKCSCGAFTANDLQYRQNRNRLADSSIALHKL